MKTTRTHAWLSFILCALLIAAMALCTMGCDDSATTTTTTTTTTTASPAERGKGNVSFPLTVTDKAGVTETFLIHTDKSTVGEALQEIGFIQGEMGNFGLYVKTVNGITADYDVDQTYWAFYVNGTYASSGVDTIPITEGDTYAFKIE